MFTVRLLSFIIFKCLPLGKLLILIFFFFCEKHRNWSLFLLIVNWSCSVKALGSWAIYNSWGPMLERRQVYCNLRYPTGKEWKLSAIFTSSCKGWLLATPTHSCFGSSTAASHPVFQLLVVFFFFLIPQAFCKSCLSGHVSPKAMAQPAEPSSAWSVWASEPGSLHLAVSLAVVAIYFQKVSACSRQPS